ncbi:MAG: penicillin-binding protein [Chitinophagaceae bacterium]|nr:penicillin-binding protein [Chitinophagaceae bacterium]
MTLFKPEKPKDLLIHFTLILASFFILLFLFFYVYLPSATNHGETITVPKLEGMSLKEMETFLDSKNLDYEINDSTYKAGVKPLTVLNQHPAPGSKVKKNRRIYITIASDTPPNVKMPKLVDQSLRSAEMVLKGYDLVLDSIHYVSSPFPNLVLKQLIKKKEILAGTLIPKGTKVTLIVGNGTGNDTLELPNLVGMSLDEADVVLSGLNLVKGTVKYVPDATEEAGTIISQKPAFKNGTTIHVGEMVDIWVAGEE